MKTDHHKSNPHLQGKYGLKTKMMMINISMTVFTSAAQPRVQRTLQLAIRIKVYCLLRNCYMKTEGAK